MLLFILNLEDGVAPPVNSTGGGTLLMEAPVAIDALQASVALLQLESQLAAIQLESTFMPVLEAEV